MAQVANPQAVSPLVVANAFIHQYVHIQHQCPELLHKFYDEVSKLGRPDNDGAFCVTTTMQGINEKILSMNYEKCRTEILSVDAQDSHSGGVHVFVTGRMAGTDNVIKSFAQTFFLAPQKIGYFVLNDMFRYVEDKKHNYQDHRATSDLEKVKQSNQDQIATRDVETLPIVEQVHHPVQEVHHPVQEVHHPVQDNQASEQPPASEEVNEKELKEESDHLHNGVQKQEEEMPVEEVHEFERSWVDADEVPEKSDVVESNIEEEPKKSYASIVMDMKGHSMPLSPPAPQKPIKKSQEPQVNLAQSPISGTQTPVSVSGSIDNVNNQEGEAEGYSIYVKGLLWSVTPAQLREAFSEFGPIKSDGIQVVKTNTQLRFCFGFVEFEVESAVQKAIEASPIEICGHHAYVEEKRSTYSRNNRARPQPDRGSGYRNEEVRGRGNNYGYSSRGGYGRYYPNNQSGYNRGNYQGGPSRSEVDGYHRIDNYGRTGGRFSRGGGGGGMVSNSTVKSAPIRVPANA